MKNFARLSPFALLAVAALISTAGCKSNQNAAVPTPATDPSAANMAPVSTDASAQTAPAPASGTAYTAAQQPAAPDQSAQYQAPSNPPTTNANYNNSAPNGGEDDYNNYAEAPVATAPEPPPAIPEYQQPPDPGEGYLWTPGYWNYAQEGYYWVPGVWVQAPYMGALWTPGYWGWHGDRFSFFRGYWGRHIGFYGGINYGFGYGGEGYQGGYWNNDHFFYNRAVNNINITIVHNVYEYPVRNYTNTRISFNGGLGGVQLRPRAAEIAALREPHAPPMRAQIQIQQESSTNRAQFANINHGRPANFAVERPIAADQNVHPVAPVPHFQAPPQQRGGMMQGHPNMPAGPMAQRPNMQAHPMEARPNPQAQHPNQPARGIEARPAPQPQNAPHMQPHPAPQPARQLPQDRQIQHPAPAQREQPRPQDRKPQ